MTTNSTSNRPVKRFSLGAVNLAVFKNKSTHGYMLNAQPSRAYFEDNEWKNSHSYNVEDLLRLKHVIDKAIDFMEANRTLLRDSEQAQEVSADAGIQETDTQPEADATTRAKREAKQASK